MGTLLRIVKRALQIALHYGLQTRLSGALCRRWIAVVAAVLCAATSQAAESPARLDESVKAVVNQYCVKCHDAEEKKGGLDLERISEAGVTQHSTEWEQVIRKLRARQMPPMGKERPAEEAYDDVVARLSSPLDQAAAEHPNPGRDGDVSPTQSDRIPKCDSRSAGAGHRCRGVIAKGRRQPWLRQRHRRRPFADAAGSLHLRGAKNQPTGGGRAAASAGRRHIPNSGPTSRRRSTWKGCRSGTRGGTLIPYTFPRDGEYEIQIRLTRDRNEEVEGLA